MDLQKVMEIARALARSNKLTTEEKAYVPQYLALLASNGADALEEQAYNSTADVIKDIRDCLEQQAGVSPGEKEMAYYRTIQRMWQLATPASGLSLRNVHWMCGQLWDSWGAEWKITANRTDAELLRDMQEYILELAETIPLNYSPWLPCGQCSRCGTLDGKPW